MHILLAVTAERACLATLMNPNAPPPPRRARGAAAAVQAPAQEQQEQQPEQEGELVMPQCAVACWATFSPAPAGTISSGSSTDSAAAQAATGAAAAAPQQPAPQLQGVLVVKGLIAEEEGGVMHRMDTQGQIGDPGGLEGGLAQAQALGSSLGRVLLGQAKREGWL